MKIWWCNQADGWEREYAAGVVRSSADTLQIRNRQTVGEARAGDIVVHYRKPFVVAFSRALENGRRESRLPEPYGHGWEFRTEYHVLRTPVHRSAFIHEIDLPGTTGFAIGSTGRVNQGYFFRFNEQGLRVVLEQLDALERLPEWLSLRGPSTSSSQSSARAALGRVTRDDILTAIHEFDEGLLAHRFEDSRDYDLLFEGRIYPPKAVAGIAARRHLGRVPAPEEFQGGINTSAFRALERNGFVIVPKDESTDELRVERAASEAAQVAEETSSSRARGQSFNQSLAARKAIEAHAMSEATSHFQRMGYDVHDCSGHLPYDLHCTRGTEELLVEVKGTTSAGEAVFLTRNEVALAQDPKGSMALFLLYDVALQQNGDDAIASGGAVRIIDPWEAPEDTLTPLTYRCLIPGK